MATADNLLNTTQNFLTPDFIKKFSNSLGQPADKIQIGLRSVIPTFLLELVKKGSSSEGAERLLSVVKKDGIEAATNVNLDDPDYMRKGEEALNQIFGNSLVSVTDNLGGQTGMSPSVITKIMSLIAPVVMGVIGKKVKNEGLTSRDLVAYLGQQKNYLAGFMPGHLGNARVPPTGLRTAIRKSVPSPQPTEAHYKVVAGPGKSYTGTWTALGALALFIIGGAWWSIDRNQDEVSMNPPSITSATVAQQMEVMPDYVTPAASMSELSEFLKSGARSELPKRFSFDTLNFASGTTELLPGSQLEIEQIANALKEHPQVTARIEGFTDNTGDYEGNLDLSTARAVAVKEELKARGIEDERIEAVGRGAESPVATNNTEEGRAQNRRIEFIITNF